MSNFSLKTYLSAVIALILGIVSSSIAQSHVPVLLWDSTSADDSDLGPGALSQLNVEDFADVLMRRMASNPVVIVFAEDSLSVEDFSRHYSGTGSSFSALQSVKSDMRLEFIPAVQTPMKALNRLLKLGYKWELVSGEVLPEPGKKVLLVELGREKEGEIRSEMLLRHDKHIASLFKQMAAHYPEVLAIYTGRESSWKTPETSYVRERRDAEATSVTGSSCNTVLTSAGTSDQIMLYTSECPVLKINSTKYNLTSGTSEAPADTRKGSHRMVVRYKLDNSSEKVNIRFRFNFTENGYWQLTQAEFEDSHNQKFILDSKSVIRAPNNFSYSCGNEAVFENSEGTVTLKFKNLRVQPGVQKGVFSTADDCVPFFTIPIWSGLFVTFLLLFIVGWGIDMMMSIHTMDRFDDPKGKPLVLNAQE